MSGVRPIGCGRRLASAIAPLCAALAMLGATPVAAQLVTVEELEALQDLKVRVYTAFTRVHASDVAEGSAQPAVYTEVGGGAVPFSTYHWTIPAEQAAAFAAAIALPPDFSLAPVAVVRDETPEITLSLIVYEVGGELQGRRAEWVTYVVTLDDPRPRAMMLETAADTVTLDPVGIDAPPAATFDFAWVDGSLETDIVSGASSFSASLDLEPVLETARWLDESWGATFDRVYWRNGVFDLRSVNGLVANRDVTQVPLERAEIDHQTAWAAFAESEPRAILLFDGRIDAVIQPWVNADDPALPLDDEFRDELLATKALVFSANEFSRADDIGQRSAEPLADFFVEPSPPSIYLNFEIPPEQQQALIDAIPLPEGFALAAVQTRRDDEPRTILSLNIYKAQGIAAGFRAEWSIYVTRGDDPVPRYMILEAQSSTLSLDPVDQFTDPADVFVYTLDGDQLQIDVQAPGTSFQATIDLPAEPDEVETTLSWAEANNIIYWRNGVADKIYYSGLIYDTPVTSVPLSAISITDGTEWAGYLQLREALVYQNQLEFIASPWNNLNPLEKEVPSPAAGLLQLAGLGTLLALRRRARRRRG